MKKTLILILLMVFLALPFLSLKTRFNLLITGNNNFILSFSPADKTVFVFPISDGTYIETVHGYGLYRVESLWHLAELEDRGGEFLKESLGAHFGLFLNGFWRENIEIKKNELLRNFLAHWWKGGETDVDRWQRLKLILFLLRTPVSQFRPISLVADYFKDSKITKEGLTFAVLNGTAHPGLAAKAALMIANLGGQVVEIGDESGDFGQCLLKGEEKISKTHSFQIIKKIFGCQVGIITNEEYRADIVLFLGEDYFRWLNQK